MREKQKSDVTRVAVLIDQSGSMYSCVDDTIGGFNELLREQKENKVDRLLLSLTLFNSTSVEERHVDTVIEDVPNLDSSTYRPASSTPLLDAVGSMITKIGDKKDVLFVVITDGHENDSSEYKLDAVRKLIKEKEGLDGWKFLFLGADIDNFGDAIQMGFNTSYSFKKNQMSAAYVSFSAAVSNYRGSDKKSVANLTVGKKIDTSS